MNTWLDRAVLNLHSLKSWNLKHNNLMSEISKQTNDVKHFQSYWINYFKPSRLGYIYPKCGQTCSVV